MNPRDEAPPVNVVAMRIRADAVVEWGRRCVHDGSVYGCGECLDIVESSADDVPAMLDEIERLREQLAAEKRRVERVRKEAQWLRDLASESHKYGSLVGLHELAADIIIAALEDEAEK